MVQGEIAWWPSPMTRTTGVTVRLPAARIAPIKSKLGFFEIRTVGDGVGQGQFPHRRTPRAYSKRDIRADHVMKFRHYGRPSHLLLAASGCSACWRIISKPFDYLGACGSPDGFSLHDMLKGFFEILDSVRLTN